MTAYAKEAFLYQLTNIPALAGVVGIFLSRPVNEGEHQESR